jgi:hypothetical protein
MMSITTPDSANLHFSEEPGLVICFFFFFVALTATTTTTTMNNTVPYLPIKCS